MLLARYANWNRPCSTLWMRLRLQKVKMRNDAINMEVNEGLLAFFAEEEGAVGGLSGGSAAAEGCHRRAGGNLLCAGQWRWCAWALESLSVFRGAQRTGRRRVSPAWQIEVEVAQARQCPGGRNQSE